MSVNRVDVTSKPLDERKRLLPSLVKGSGVLVSEELSGSATEVTDAVSRLGLEGIVAKRRSSQYEVGRRSGAWVKFKLDKQQEFVIGGYKPGFGSFESLLVGYYDRSKLIFASKVRAGLTPYLRASIFKQFAGLATERCPFVNLPSLKTSHWGWGVTPEQMREMRWLKPKLVAQVRFVEWTPDGHLRHSAFVGLRADKLARDVRREGRRT